jgi:hypothetical protein
MGSLCVSYLFDSSGTESCSLPIVGQFGPNWVTKLSCVLPLSLLLFIAYPLDLVAVPFAPRIKVFIGVIF